MHVVYDIQWLSQINMIMMKMTENDVQVVTSIVRMLYIVAYLSMMYYNIVLYDVVRVVR